MALCRIPGHVRGQDQRGDLAVLRPGGLNGLCRIARHPARFRRHACPVRNRLRDADRIALQRGFEPQVVVGMVPHDVQDPTLRLPCVVQVRESVAKAGGQMQKRCRHLARHPEIAIRRARYAAFEQTQDAAQVGMAVKGCHEMHLGGAGIGKAQPHAACQQGPHQGFRAVHRCLRCHPVTLQKDGFSARWQLATMKKPRRDITAG